MNDRQRRFVEAYVALGNATAAAKEAGYSQDTAYAQGHRLLKDADIRQAIDERQANLANELGLTRQWVLEQLRAKTGNEGASAVRALELIGKAHGMWVDRAQVEQSGLVTYTLDLGSPLGESDDVDTDDDG